MYSTAFSFSFPPLFSKHWVTSRLQRSLVAAATTIAIGFAAAPASANSAGWTWVGGDQIPHLEVEYGQMGVASETNSPGRREGASTWTDPSGNLWLFGGSITATDDDASGTGNDIWMYNVETGTWTWKKGKDFTNFISLYGTRGVESAAIAPGTREQAASWVDKDGMVWIFGGLGFDKTGPQGRLNDLWRYNPATNNWAWMGGSQTQGASGNYGTQGVAAAGNWPGSRSDAAFWTDANGDFWLFGGYGTAGFGDTNGALGDLWKYDVSEELWTWMKGSDELNAVPVTGTQGTAADDVTPGGLYRATAYRGSGGKLWLFGGVGRSISNPASGDLLDDLWSYDPATNRWTWMAGDNLQEAEPVYGTLGVPHADNTPGSRVRALPWVDANGNFWLYGGSTSIFDGDDTLADFWKFDAATALWSWEGGSQEVHTLPVFGTVGVPDPAVHPGSRDSTLTWTDASGNPWFYGGSPVFYDDVSEEWTDLWKYDVATEQWTWVDGPKAAVPPSKFGGMYGSDPVKAPGGRQEAATWTSSDDDLWLFGGLGIDINRRFGLLNDLWHYDTGTGEWAMISGSMEVDAPAVYGPLGVSGVSYNPGARRNGVTWVDNDGNFWLFGGKSFRSSVPDYILRPDLWKYDVANNRWTWVNGGRFNQDAGVYNTIGVESPDNKPGAREGAASWVDSAGNLWMFGGYGRGTSTSTGELNDLWKYNISNNQWTWMHGSSERSERATYGTQGTPARENTPGGRHNSVFWTDPDGKFWLFGGEGFGSGFAGHLSDLWMYDPAINQWTWVHGETDRDELPVFGTMLVEAPDNTPGGKAYADGWVDESGDLLLFGGEGPSADSTFPWRMSDLWKFSRSTSQWTWMGGSELHDELPVYGSKGQARADTTPGARRNYSSWNTADGRFWLLGGDALQVWNDMWVYGTGVVQTAARDWQLFE